MSDPQYPTAPAYDPGSMPPGPGLYGRASGPRAGFWRRFGAAFIDGLIVGIPTWIVIWLLFGLDIRTQNVDGTTTVSYGGVFAQSLLAGLVLLVYRTVLDGGPAGQTLGKKALGIRVVDAGTGKSIGYARGFGRAGGKLIFDLLINLCLIGVVDYLWMLWDREKQCLHDKMVNSYVVPVAAYPIE
jgi:uncharacterized RDD family membrane protein YckC